MHKAGFVNIVGNPNVGKSTLMNVLVGERVSIATFKAQTTRHRIMGIYNTDDMQIVFSDTPGVLKPNYKLQESMLNFSTSALTDADILLYVTDVIETPDKNNEFVEKVRQMTVPVLLLINKIDLTDQEKLVELVEDWKTLLPQAEIIPISATSKFNVDYVMKRIKELLPDSPPYFEKDQWTDKPARFFVNEIIREKILLYYDKEIPYAVEVVVEEFIQGKELTVAIMQDGGMAVALPVINIVPHSGVYDFHSKYTKGETEYLVPAPLDKETTRHVQELAVATYKVLGCSGVARVDVMLDEAGKGYVLEANTVPGMTATSLVPKAAAAVGISFPDLCEKILLSASLNDK